MIPKPWSGNFTLPERDPIPLAREVASRRGLEKVLNQIGHRPIHALGQNFLIDFNLAEKTVRIADPLPSLPVLEIGPGVGALTGLLLGKGLEVHAVERDRRLARFLKDRFRPWMEDRVFFPLEGDAVETPVPPSLAGRPYQIIANLPYAITTPWLAAILDSGKPLPKRVSIMIQDETARRIRAAPGGKNYGPISLFLGQCYQIVTSHPVAPTCFFPPPEVRSVFLRLELRSDPFLFHPETRRMIRGLFAHRRKQIHRCFRQIGAEALWDEWQQRTAIHPTIRPEAIQSEAWRALDGLVRGSIPDKPH